MLQHATRFVVRTAVRALCMRCHRACTGSKSATRQCTFVQQWQRTPILHTPTNVPVGATWPVWSNFGWRLPLPGSSPLLSDARIE